MPGLIEHLRQHGAEYDRILFWTYRYYQTFFGLPLVADRAILVPTAEEDPLIWVDVVDRLFSLPIGYLFLTPEEAQLVSGRASRPLAPSAVIGCGVDPAFPHATEVDLSKVGVSEPFILYLGRIEPNKGCETLLEYFDKYLDSGGPPVRSLWPVFQHGDSVAPIDQMPRRRRRCDAETLLAKARLLVVPSPFEPQHGAARGVESGAAGTRQRAVRRPARPGRTSQRGVVVSICERVRRVAHISADTP